MNLLEDEGFLYTKRVRADFNFKIKCPQGNFPALVLVFKKMENKEFGEVAKKVLVLKDDVINQIDDTDWYSCQAFYWFDSKDLNVMHKIGAYLFFDSTDKYYIDDLEINIREY